MFWDKPRVQVFSFSSLLITVARKLINWIHQRLSPKFTFHEYLYFQKRATIWPVFRRTTPRICSTRTFYPRGLCLRRWSELDSLVSNSRVRFSSAGRTAPATCSSSGGRAGGQVAQAQVAGETGGGSKKKKIILFSSIGAVCLGAIITGLVLWLGGDDEKGDHLADKGKQEATENPQDEQEGMKMEEVRERRIRPRAQATLPDQPRPSLLPTSRFWTASHPMSWPWPSLITVRFSKKAGRIYCR